MKELHPFLHQIRSPEMRDIHAVKYKCALRTPTDNEECKRKEIGHLIRNRDKLNFNG